MKRWEPKTHKQGGTEQHSAAAARHFGDVARDRLQIEAYTRQGYPKKTSHLAAVL